MSKFLVMLCVLMICIKGNVNAQDLPQDTTEIKLDESVASKPLETPQPPAKKTVQENHSTLSLKAKSHTAPVTIRKPNVHEKAAHSLAATPPKTGESTTMPNGLTKSIKRKVNATRVRKLVTAKESSSDEGIGVLVLFVVSGAVVGLSWMCRPIEKLSPEPQRPVTVRPIDLAPTSSFTSHTPGAPKGVTVNYRK